MWLTSSYFNFGEDNSWYFSLNNRCGWISHPQLCEVPPEKKSLHTAVRWKNCSWVSWAIQYNAFFIILIWSLHEIAAFLCNNIEPFSVRADYDFDMTCKKVYWWPWYVYNIGMSCVYFYPMNMLKISLLINHGFWKFGVNATEVLLLQNP